jgi:ATP synthase I chain
VSDLDVRLLRDINRRNWIILTLFSLASLPWRSAAVTLGVLSGGLLAIIAHHWRYRALLGIIGSDAFGAARRFRVGYIVRLGTLALTLYVLIAILKVDPIALVTGLSVVVVNIFFTTWQRSF